MCPVRSVTYVSGRSRPSGYAICMAFLFCQRTPQIGSIGSNIEIKPRFACSETPILNFLMSVRVPVRCSQRGMPNPLLLQVLWRAPLSQHGDPRVPKRMKSSPRERVVAVSSPSSFRQAESSVIVDALRAAAGRGGAAERLKSGVPDLREYQWKLIPSPNSSNAW